MPPGGSCAPRCPSRAPRPALPAACQAPPQAQARHPAVDSRAKALATCHSKPTQGPCGPSPPTPNAGLAPFTQSTQVTGEGKMTNMQELKKGSWPLAGGGSQTMGSLVRVQAPDEFTTAAPDAQHRPHTAARPLAPPTSRPKGTSGRHGDARLTRRCGGAGSSVVWRTPPSQA